MMMRLSTVSNVTAILNLLTNISCKFSDDSTQVHPDEQSYLTKIELHLKLYKVGQKFVPFFHRNNFINCQPIFVIFGTYTL